MNKKRLCCFYVSDIHLITMLLPYINKRTNESTEIITILETDMTNCAKKVMNGIQGRKTEELLKIDWSKKDLKYLQECDVENKIVLIYGSDAFMEKANEIVNKKKEVCTILNCYEIMQGSTRLREIFEGHDKVVSTAGEKEFEEVFVGYEKTKYEQIGV